MTCRQVNRKRGWVGGRVRTWTLYCSCTIRNSIFTAVFHEPKHQLQTWSPKANTLLLAFSSCKRIDNLITFFRLRNTGYLAKGTVKAENNFPVHGAIKSLQTAGDMGNWQFTKMKIYRLPHDITDERFHLHIAVYGNLGLSKKFI